MYEFDPLLIFNKSYIEAIGNSNINITHCCYCEFFPDYIKNGKHTHGLYELSYVIEGQGMFFHGDEKYPVKKGSAFIVSPNVVHEIVSHPKNILCFISFLFKINVRSNTKSKIHDELILRNFLSGHDTCCDGLYHLCAYVDFIKQYGSHPNHSDRGIMIALKSILIESLEFFAVKKDVEYELASKGTLLIDEAQQYVARNINKNLKVKEIAEHFHVSERCLEYHFKNLLDTTLKEYINTVRLGNAVNYLQMDYTITETSIRMGFSDITHFSRTFKDYFGISPKQYQTNYNQNLFNEQKYNSKSINNI